MPYIQNLLGVLTILGQLLFVLTILGLLIKKNNAWTNFLKNNSIWLILIVSLTAMLGSLYFSDYLGFEPCKLCWYQRIALYPIVVLTLAALIKKDKNITHYTLWLAIIGGLIALNHYFLQITNVSILPCSAVGYSQSCAQVFTLQFGYITIPLMALTAAILIATLSILARRR